MGETLDRVIEITSRQTGIAAAELNATSAIDQDIRISGDDVRELAELYAADIHHNNVTRVIATLHVQDITHVQHLYITATSHMCNISTHV